MYMCIYVCMYACMHACMHAYACMHACMHAGMYLCVYNIISTYDPNSRLKLILSDKSIGFTRASARKRELPSSTTRLAGHWQICPKTMFIPQMWRLILYAPHLVAIGPVTDNLCVERRKCFRPSRTWAAWRRPALAASARRSRGCRRLRPWQHL